MKLQDQKFCQSCGMPMEGQRYGTEANGGISEDYCGYCYGNGKFTADVTMEQMIDFCAKPMADAAGMTTQQAKERMGEFFPSLKRWR